MTATSLVALKKDLKHKYAHLQKSEIRAVGKTDYRNVVVYTKGDVEPLLYKEIVRTDDGGSIITRKALTMTTQAIEAAEILEESTKSVEAHLARFHRVADQALDETKKKISQLNDYSNRLSTSLVNLNKVMADERMGKAIENAERIATALKLLDELEKKGSLEKILAALK